MKDISKLEEILKVNFKHPELLKQALTHRSYLNEHPSLKMEHNERLEFLGDAVLELIVTENLYENYPNNPEGEMTNWRAALVNAKMLSEIGKELELDDFLFLSRGEAKDKNQKARGYIIANAMEAVIGAIYLDLGWDTAKKFIIKNILVKLPDILKHKLYIDAKSRFQEMAQDKVGVTPSYQVISESGPDHNKKFIIGVYLEEELVAKGEGTSKQEAQMDAAEKGLVKKNW
ncbi:MAG: ribonuclease III [Patescibacteria group bacterium]|nr:ribonuclease III [Patescibacteria group bacterium]